MCVDQIEIVTLVTGLAGVAWATLASVWCDTIAVFTTLLTVS